MEEEEKNGANKKRKLERTRNENLRERNEGGKDNRRKRGMSTVRKVNIDMKRNQWNKKRLHKQRKPKRKEGEGREKKEC